MRPSSSVLEVKDDRGSSKSKEREEISEMKKTIKSHMIVAALIATVTFAAGFTLPGGYVQSGSNNQGMAVLSLSTNNTTKGKDRDMANATRLIFITFVMADGIAMLLSMCALFIYFLASFPIKDKKTVLAYLWYGYTLTWCAMVAMLIAFVAALKTVLHPFLLLGRPTFFFPLSLLLFSVSIVLQFIPSPRRILCLLKHYIHIKPKSYKLELLRELVI